MSNFSIQPMIQHDVSLLPYNTFKLPTTARFFVEIQSIEELTELYCHPIWKNEKKCFLGSGSNVLFVEPYFSGLIIKVNILGISYIKEDDQYVWIKVGGGENWHAVVLDCISKGYSGIENLSYIPGTAGAAPIQNIGAYGVELKDIFEELEAFHLSEGKIVNFKKTACQFAYRHSIFKTELKDQYMICSITLKLNKYPLYALQYGEIQKTIDELGITQLNTQSISETITYIRKNKLPDPTVLPNVGSFFKNPLISNEHFHQLKKQYYNLPSYTHTKTEVKIPAGWLIEQIGWKGKTKKHVGTYHKQALVIVNHEGKATGKDILEFANEIIQAIQKNFNIALIPEVTIIE